MTNPWLKLPCEPPYILSQDADGIRKHNERVTQDIYRVSGRSIPEPFIGNPESASVVLLSKNPGDDPFHLNANESPDFKTALFANLRHELRDYAFYPLNPIFSSTGAAQWWNQHLGPLFKRGKLDRARVAERLLVIEWFPYPSVKAHLSIKGICSSQHYFFDLAKLALRDKIIIGMRGKRYWTDVDPRFADVPWLRGYLNPVISPNNMQEGFFTKIVEALR